MPTCPKVWYLASEWVRQGAAMAYNDFQTQPDCPAMPIWVNGEHAQQIFWLPWKACEMSLHPMLEKCSQFSLLLHIQKPWFPWTFLEPGPRATSSLPGLPGRRTTTRQRDPWTSEIFLALRYELGAHGFKQVYNISHDGSMVLLYMVLHESHQQKTLYVSINIPAPWIRHGYIYIYIYILLSLIFLQFTSIYQWKPSAKISWSLLISIHVRQVVLFAEILW